MAEYNRNAAVRYARKWAMSRNKNYADFEYIGGDCTNFVSQCLYAGSGVMDFTPDTGWYYKSLSDRAAAWSGVEFLYKYLTDANRIGPAGEDCAVADVLPGDVIQLSFDGTKFTHSMIVSARRGSDVYVCTHSYDSVNRLLRTYDYLLLRAIAIKNIIRSC